MVRNRPESAEVGRYRPGILGNRLESVGIYVSIGMDGEGAGSADAVTGKGY